MLRSIPAKIPAFFTKADQSRTAGLGDVQRTEQVEAAIHNLGGCPGNLSLETVDNGLDARTTYVPHPLRGQAHPPRQRPPLGPPRPRLPPPHPSGGRKIPPPLCRS